MLLVCGTIAENVSTPETADRKPSFLQIKLGDGSGGWRQRRVYRLRIGGRRGLGGQAFEQLDRRNSGTEAHFLPEVMLLPIRPPSLLGGPASDEINGPVIHSVRRELRSLDVALRQLRCDNPRHILENTGPELDPQRSVAKPRANDQ